MHIFLSSLQSPYPISNFLVNLLYVVMSNGRYFHIHFLSSSSPQSCNMCLYKKEQKIWHIPKVSLVISHPQLPVTSKSRVYLIFIEVVGWGETKQNIWFFAGWLWHEDASLCLSELGASIWNHNALLPALKLFHKDMINLGYSLQQVENLWSRNIGIIWEEANII